MGDEIHFQAARKRFVPNPRRCVSVCAVAALAPRGEACANASRSWASATADRWWLRSSRGLSDGSPHRDSDVRAAPKRATRSGVALAGVCRRLDQKPPTRRSGRRARPRRTAMADDPFGGAGSLLRTLIADSRDSPSPQQTPPEPRFSLPAADLYRRRIAFASSVRVAYVILVPMSALQRRRRHGDTRARR